MENILGLFSAFGDLLMNPIAIGWILVGVVAGFTFGALPGLTATMGVALFIPLTFPLPPDIAVGMMIALYCGSMTGGAIPAILLNIPGTPSAVITTLDGHPMARRGEATRAYGWALISSVIGGIVAWVALVTIAPPLARLALLLGPAEYAALALLGMVIVASIISGQVMKGILGAVLGISFSIVGLDPVTGEGRWTFGTLELLRGIGLMPTLIGLLVIPEVMSSLFEREGGSRFPPDRSRMLPSLVEFGSQMMNNLRSSIVGVAIGIVPALGGSVASLIAYDQAKRFEKDGHLYGKGAPGGVIASEAANNGVTGGALIPLLTLGIPGDTVTAMLLGGLMIHGLQPGPRLFETSGDVVWSIMATVLLANIVIIGIGIVGFRLFAKVLDVPRHLLAPALFILAVVGTYSLSNQWFDVIVMLCLGTLGFLMTLANYPVYPVVIGVVLAPLLESEVRRALVISGGDWSVFVTRPVSAVILAIAAAILILPSLFAHFKGPRQEPANPQPETHE